VPRSTVPRGRGTEERSRTTTGRAGHASEDALYFDARSWSADDDDRARSLQQDLKILLNEQASERHVEEYPSDFTDRAKAARGPKIPRNSRCPCSSGQKYKRGHGR